MNSKNSKAGFTLIEMLVVISIILIASSIIFIGGNTGDSSKLSSSHRIVSGIAQGARGQAILKGATTRLIIYSDSASNLDVEKKLRFFGIVYFSEELDAAGNVISSGWKAATQGTYLPEGIYFNESLSTSKGWPTTKMSINYPRQSLQVEGSGDEYFYYEFGSNGTMASGFSNTWLALQAGSLRPDSSGVLSIDFTEVTKEGLKSALIFRRVGTTTPVLDPDAI